eukprot:TRINITY_DN6358_c0_g1_i1.p2 TRINITY_DN6358_c0_g1~~TRINITY_DN6358_c0_g1_i1.p2  ORF type:complete len:266 (-),score=50.81 TRINITY_DN6358_c0_g1_i1:113-910(-)
MATRLAAAAVGSLAVFALQGCGDAGSDAPGDSTTSTTFTAAPNTTTTTTTTATTTTTTRANPDTCLCVFDVDRTLTGRQHYAAQCPGDLEQPNVQDSAYQGGPLVLSEAAQFIDHTFCAGCYLSTISAGSASGPNSPERTVMLNILKVGPGANLLPNVWGDGCNPKVSPLVLGCPDGHKQETVPGVLKWYADHGVSIEDKNVHFFDDRVSNVRPFEGKPYNARQISCGSRDGAIGLCGAKPDELVGDTGVKLCSADALEADVVAV